MPECRICLESNEEPMIRPCNCAGSAEYIHNECLREYLLYYPDGICRVCQAHMKIRNPADVWILFELFVGLTTLISFSEIHIIIKTSLLCFTIACLFVYYKCHLLDSFIVKFLSAIPVFLLLGALEDSTSFGISVVLTISLSVAYIIQIVPFLHIIIIVATIVVAAYIISISYIIIYKVGIWANITMISLVCLVGYAFVKARR